MSVRFPLIDGLRAIAALSVVACHVTAVLGTGDGVMIRLAERLGPFGVSLFFIISGFVLYRPFLTTRGKGVKIDLRRFAVRRIARIVPAYWVALTVLSLTGAITTILTEQFWIFYGFMQVYWTETAGQGLPPAWSLCVEVTFYALLPVFATVMHRRGAGAAGRGVRTELVALVLLAVAGLCVRALFVAVVPNLSLSLTIFSTFSWFAVGMMLAIVNVHARSTPVGCFLDRLAERPALCTVMSFSTLAVLMLWPMKQFGEPRGFAEVMIEFALFGVCLALLFLPAIFGSQRRDRRRFVLGNPVVLWLGRISYGIYLWHDPLVKNFTTAGIVQASPFPLVTYLLLVLGGTIALAALSHYLVERPILRRVGSRAAARTRTAGPEAVPLAAR